MSASSDDAMYLDTIAEVTFTQLVTASGLPEGELVELVRYGALIPRDPDATTWTFEARSLAVSKSLAPAPRFRARSARGQRRAALPRANRGLGGNPRLRARLRWQDSRWRPADDTALTHVRHRQLVP
jgi:hypothetical protein